MPIELTMPRLSDTMESGTIIKWNVKEGDEVTSGSAVADVETDKATMEMQVFDDGKLAKILVPEGKLVPVGTVIALIAEEGEDVADVAKSSASSGNGAAKSTDGSAKAKSGKKDGASKPSSEPTADGDVDDDHDDDDDSEATTNDKEQSTRDRSKSDSDDDGAARVRVSPVARRIADEHGIDVSALKGSGPSGRVVKDDVLAAVESGAGTDAKAERGSVETSSGKSSGKPSDRSSDKPSDRSSDRSSDNSSGAPAPIMTRPVAKLEAGTIELSGMRQTIAKRLVESKTTIPHYQVTMRFDMAPLLDLRKTLNGQLEAQGVKLSLNDFLVRACALAIHRHPEFNASWAGQKGIEVHGRVNVGMAISLPRERGGGLVVGVIKDADRKGLRQLSEESKALAEKARSKGLSADEMSDSTFTISNLGMYGVDHFTAIINPPNSAILAVGAAMEVPVVRNGEIVVGHEMSATLSLDHRVIDGAMAAEYLGTLKALMENPAGLLV